MKVFRAIKVFSFILLSFYLVSCQFGAQYPHKVSKEFNAQYLQSEQRDALYKHFMRISDEKSASSYIKTFDNAFSLIYYNYVTEVDLPKLLNEAYKAASRENKAEQALDQGLKAATNQLDSHSDWLNRKELIELNNMINGEYVGIGTVISKHAQGVELQRVYENGPAYKAGLKTGDIITHADGQSLKGKDLGEVGEILRGKKGTIASVRILRKDKAEDFKIRRDKVEINPIWAEIKNKNIIYLRLDSFNNNASYDLQKSLSALQKQGGQSLILDLRANPGGLLTEAIEVSDIFLPKKREIVSAQKREKIVTDSWYSRKKDSSQNIKMIVLIDEHSASASEIVAAALKDNNRAIIMGHRSFGKGSIQEIIPVASQGALRLTFALYQSPDGKLIQAAGVTPHIQVNGVEKEGERLENQEGVMVPKNRHIDKAKYVVEGKNCKVYEDDDLILNCAIELLKAGKLGNFRLEK